MLFDFNFKSTTLLFCCFHGTLFSVLLLTKGARKGEKSSIWLSIFTFLAALYILPFALGYAGWYSKNPYREFLFYVPFQQLFLFPVVLYFYFQTLLDKNFHFSKNLVWHFVPPILYLLYTIFIFLADKFYFGYSHFYANGRDKDFDSWYQVAGFLSLATYLILSLQLLKKYKILIFNTYSFADELTFSWAKKFLYALLSILVLRLLFFILNPEWANFGAKFWYYCCFSVLVYYISINGLLNVVTSLTSLSQKDLHVEPPKLKTQKGNQLDDELSSARDLKKWKVQLEALMTNEKYYKNPELSVFDLAKELNTHPKKISQTINQEFAMNFNDYVNQYRIKAVIDLLHAGAHEKQTLLAIAFDCGFNSKSTFNRVFKYQTSYTPAAFCQKLTVNTGAKS